LNGDVKARDISLGVSDRQVAEQKMRENIRDQERVSVGLMAPAAQRETFENPMEKLVDGYVADLKALGRLRRGEINALHGGDFHLDTANPYWMLPAAFVKNRKEQPRPLHPELVAELQKLKAAGKLKPEDLVFPDGVPTMKEIRKDFKKAEIPLKDERGHVVDFHALRTTYITRLQRAGVSPREAMELARHSDMRLTMKTYTDVAQLPLAATVRRLPSIGDSQIDSQTLVAERPAVSPVVIGLKAIKVGKIVGNIDGNHGTSSIVTFSHESENGGERGIRTSRFCPSIKGNLTETPE
jgi:hypothetical protein